MDGFKPGFRDVGGRPYRPDLAASALLATLPVGCMLGAGSGGGGRLCGL